MLKDIAAVEVAVLVEVIVDRGMGGGEFLQGLYIPELRYRSFSSPERLVGILGSIVEPPTALLIGCRSSKPRRLQKSWHFSPLPATVCDMQTIAWILVAFVREIVLSRATVRLENIALRQQVAV